MKPSEFACAEAQPHLPLLAGLPLNAGGAAGGVSGELAGDLEPALAASVRAHTASCANCAAELQRIESALEALACVRDESQREVDLWAGIRAELANSGVLRPDAGQAVELAGASASTAKVSRVGHKSWIGGARLRRWSAAAGFLLALGTAGFIVSNSGAFDPAAAPISETPGASGGDVVADVVPVSTSARTDVSPTPLALSGPSLNSAGGLRRATLEEQRQFLQPAQVFNAQTRNASSAGVVAGDVRLR